MSNDDRIVFPDEVESMKAAAMAGTGAGKTIDDDRIVFPDEVENMKATATGSTTAKKTTADFDYDRIVFPNEVEEVKTKAAAAAAGYNSVEAPEIDPRNKLQGAGECKCVGHIQAKGRCSSVEAPQFDLRFHFHHSHHSGSKAKGTGGCSVEASQSDLGPISPR